MQVRSAPLRAIDSTIIDHASYHESTMYTRNTTYANREVQWPTDSIYTRNGAQKMPSNTQA